MGKPMVHVVRGEQADPTMEILLVRPGKEDVAELTGVFNTGKARREFGDDEESHHPIAAWPRGRTRPSIERTHPNSGADRSTTESIR